MILAWTLETGAGSWNPLVWVAVMAVALVLTLVIRSFGEKTYKRDTDQVKPFFSGNELPTEEAMHIRGDNLYWGFVEALKEYYRRLIPTHNGVSTDYVLWFFGVLSIVLLIGLVL
jgi:hypothetical protein